MLHSICIANLENSAVATRPEKVSFHSIPKKDNAKDCSDYHTIELSSHASKIMLKILQARLQQYMNHELPDGQAGFRKGRGTRDQIDNIHWIIEKSKRVPEKHLFLFYWLHLSLWLCGSQQTVENSSSMGIPDHLICLLRNLYAGQEAKLEPEIEQQTGSKLGKEYIKAVYCHPAYLTFMQSTSCKMSGWMKHKLESKLPGVISITSDICRWHHPYGRKQRRTKEALDESERRE